MKKFFIAVSMILGSAFIYAGAFPYILSHQAEVIARGAPYCLVAPVTEPAVFSGWAVSTGARLRKINGFRDLSLFEILARRLRGRSSEFRYTQLIHLGIVVAGKAYHWSFAQQEFVENDSYVDFRKEFNRAPSFPEECAVSR